MTGGLYTAGHVRCCTCQSPGMYTYAPPYLAVGDTAFVHYLAVRPVLDVAHATSDAAGEEVLDLAKSHTLSTCLIK